MLKYSQIYLSISTCPSPASSSPRDTDVAVQVTLSAAAWSHRGEGPAPVPQALWDTGVHLHWLLEPSQPSPCYRLFGEAGEICSAIWGAVAGRSGVCSHFNSSQTQQTGDFVASQTLILDDGNREMKAQQRERSSPSFGSGSAAFPC